MLDLAIMTEAEFTETLRAFNLGPDQIEQVAALIDEARVRDVIPDVVPVHIDPRRVLDLFYGRTVQDVGDG